MASGDGDHNNLAIANCWNICDVGQVDVKTRFDVLAYKILPNTKCSDVKMRFIAYILAELLPVGTWYAFWMPGDKKMEILVKVTGLEDNDLRASIEFQKISDYINGQNSILVPLIELIPVYDDKYACDDSIEQLARVNTAIDYVKFFYQNLWRPWDNNDEDDPVFAENYLGPRLQLYGDIEAGAVPEEVVSKCKALIAEAQENQRQLELMQNEINVSDSDEELREPELAQFVMLNLRQEELRRECELMENPALRLLFRKKKMPMKMAAHGRREGNETVIHIVAKKLQIEMLENLKLPSSTVIHHHVSFDMAVASCYEGDTVLLFPGIYKCEGVGWLDDSITVKGVSENADQVVLEADNGSDIFLSCDATKVTLCNVTLKPSQNMLYTIVIHRGETVLKNCVIHGESVAVDVCAGGHLQAEDCWIKGAKNYGVRLRDDATASLSNVTVRDCWQGICVQNTEMQGASDFCPLELSDCTFENNDMHDVVVLASDSLNSSTYTCSGEEFHRQYNGELPLVKISNVKFPQKVMGNYAVAT